MMSYDAQGCSFCRVVAYFADRGMLDEYDRAIVLHHLETRHAGLSKRGPAAPYPRTAGP